MTELPGSSRDEGSARPIGASKSDFRRSLEYSLRHALEFIEDLPSDPVRFKNAEEAVELFEAPLPEDGLGDEDTLRKLVGEGTDGAIRSAGPRFFHWVIGGSTPASLAADWYGSALDQNNGAWGSSPIGAKLEMLSLSWLKDLFGLPQPWGGVLTTGATMANFTALACARRWWANHHGVDVDADGMTGLPPLPVFAGGYVHPSDTKALAMLGLGRSSVRLATRDAVGRLDLEALEDELKALNGAPAIIIGSAGEVNAGDFDPISSLADLAEKYGCWLHIDGAFGLFAALSPRTAHLVEGVDRAHSVIADGHKWLNVPYDCGFAFVRDPALLPGVFALAAAYLPAMSDERPVYFNLGPESSRRARSLPVWATLHAYGRSGYRAMFEHHLDLALRVGDLVEESEDLELLAPIQLNIVCFRFRPSSVTEEDLDRLNLKLGLDVLEDGRVYVGTTSYGGRAAFRPAIVNWMTTESDVELLVEVVRDLGTSLVRSKSYL